MRAAYGHSVAVDLDADDASDPGDDSEVPATLDHGTAPRSVESIRAAGLRPMDRQAVHLSGTRAAAREVGRRHTQGTPVVFAVDADALRAAGHAVRERGEETYTAERVPPAFTRVVEESDEGDADGSVDGE